MLEILLIVHVVDLPIGWVLPGLKISGSVLDVVLFAVFAHSSLLLLQEVLVVTRSLHVSVLEGALIWSPTSVSWCDLVVQP